MEGALRAAVPTAGPGSRLLQRVRACPGQGRRGGRVVHCVLFLLLLPRPEFTLPREGVRAAGEAERVQSSSSGPQVGLSLPGQRPPRCSGASVTGTHEAGADSARERMFAGHFTVYSRPLSMILFSREAAAGILLQRPPRGLGFPRGSLVPPTRPTPKFQLSSEDPLLFIKPTGGPGQPLPPAKGPYVKIKSHSERNRAVMGGSGP